MATTILSTVFSSASSVAFRLPRFFLFPPLPVFPSPLLKPPRTTPSPLRFLRSPFFSSSSALVCKAADEYVFPDPIPEFADVEIEKFRTHMFEKLTKKNEIFGDNVQDVVGVCTEILSNFLHSEYGGPGTLLVIPFIDMADTLNERGLPGGPQAARAAVVWAQKHIDKDWKEWTEDTD